MTFIKPYLIIFSLVCSAPHQKKHTLKTHSVHTLAHKLSEGNIRRGSVSGCREDGREVDRLRPISGVSGGTPPRPDRYTRPPLTRLWLIRIYWPAHLNSWFDDYFCILLFFSCFTWPSPLGRSRLKANEMTSHWTGGCRWNYKYFH